MWFFYWGFFMKIDKIINNNVVASHDKDNREVVIMGCGLGFQKRAGDVVEENKIEKIFRIDSPASMERFKDLVADLPLEYLRVSNEIVSYAKEKLEVKLSQNVYLTLTDHISFAIERFKEGMQFSNALFEEVKRFYKDEFLIGKHAIGMITEKLGVELPEDEAASIALHIVNAEFGTKVQNTFTITNVLKDMMNIIVEEAGVIDEDSLYRDRLLISLKYLVHRMLLLPVCQVKEDKEFYNYVEMNYKKECSVVNRIRKYVLKNYTCVMTEEEKIYLALDIKRMNDSLGEKQ
jgi:beta-glucoside operon transcriptional antiterminator